MLVKQHDIKVYLHLCGSTYHHLENALFKGLLVSVEPICELWSSNDKAVFNDILQAECTYKYNTISWESSNTINLNILQYII